MNIKNSSSQITWSYRHYWIISPKNMTRNDRWETKLFLGGWETARWNGTEAVLYLPHFACKIITLCNYVNHFSLSFFLDFSHRRPPPVSDHFVEHQGWSLTREVSYTMLLLFLMFVTAVCVLFFFTFLHIWSNYNYFDDLTGSSLVNTTSGGKYDIWSPFNGLPWFQCSWNLEAI